MSADVGAVIVLNSTRLASTRTARPTQCVPPLGPRDVASQTVYAASVTARGETVTDQPEVSRVVDLVSYQDGAVVSRIVVKRETGNVTLFAFDAGQELSEHTTPYDALVQVVDGEAEITVAGRPYRLRGGDMIVMPAHQPHALKAVSRFKMLLTMIRS
jgi:quercetin dioxygenase-like cupin family protein